MVKACTIGEDIIAGLVPVLKDKAVFESAHETARKTNTQLHITHSSFLAMAIERTQYDTPEVRAINVGATAYELLAAFTPQQIPADFALDILESRTLQSGYEMVFSEELQARRNALVADYPELAQGLYELCISQLGPNSQSVASTYGLGGAGLMNSAYQDILDMWEVRRLLGTVDFGE